MEAAPRAWWAVELGDVLNVKEVAISQRDKYGKIRESLLCLRSYDSSGCNALCALLFNDMCQLRLVDVCICKVLSG